MKLSEFDFYQPRSLQEACLILKEHIGKAVILAGGTALMGALRLGLSKPEVVIGLKGLVGLDYITRDENCGLAIGSMVTLEILEKSPLILSRYASLAQAAQVAAVPPVRHKATIGGNLSLDTRCIYYNQSEFWRSGQAPCFKRGGEICYAVQKGRRCQAVYQGDLGPVLLAMGAKVKIVSQNGEKIFSLADFFTGRGEKPNILKPDEILTEVQIPSGDQATGVYEKLRVRQGMEFPMAGVAVQLRKSPSGSIEQVRLVLGAVGSSPIEVSHARQLLGSQKPTDELLQSLSQEAMDRARPVGNLAMNPNYRKKMVGVLVKRAFHRALMMNSEMNAE